MSKPDQYMPFFGNDFFQAVEGYSPEIIAAYLRAIWHYWHQKGCKGLINDETYLMNVCRVNQGDWQKVKSVLFDSGEFFKKEHGLWQQTRAREIYERQLALIEQNKKKTELARKARWQK